MITAKWKEGAGFFSKADAQLCAEEILSIGTDVKPEEVVEKAKDETTELHKCFTWDNEEAAEKYRLIQARNVLRLIVIKEEEVPSERPEIRMFYKTTASEGYKPIQIIVRKEDEYKQLLEKAYAELRVFKAKYSMLTELQEIFNLIS